MARRMALPKIGVNMTEATIYKWLVKVGEHVKEGDAILEAETDKSTQEIYATEGGVVAQLLFAEGDTAACYEDILVLIDEGESYYADETQAKAQAPAGQAEPPQSALPVATVPGQTEEKSAPVVPNSRVRISPLAKKLAKEYGIALSALHPAVPDGRIVKADVMRCVQTADAPETNAPAERIALTPIRKTIARRMTESVREKPSASLGLTANASALIGMRTRFKARGAKVSIDAILAKVAGRVLALHPHLNAVLEDDSLVLLRDINVGIAVDTEKGLMVPVLRNADRTPLQELGTVLAQRVDKAKAGTLSLEEMSGGTFTVTNLGGFGIEEFTAIINPPECCILAVGAITDVFVPDGNGQPVLQKRVHLTLSFDHRMVDGAAAARFLRDFKEHLECPELMI